MQTTIKACFCFLVLTFTTTFADDDSEHYLDQFAPSPEDTAGWEDARKEYNAWVATPEFIGRELSERDEQVRNELEVACLETFQVCQAYIRSNRLAILTALPDNPLYWERFWGLLEVNPHTIYEQQDQPDYTRLIPTTYWWFYRDLALDGRLDIDDALKLQAGLNHWLAAHHTLLGRMMIVAMRGIAYRQISYAMAQASRDRDEQALLALVQAASTPPLEANSFGRTMWMEQAYVINVMTDLDTDFASNAADIESAIYEVSPRELPDRVAQVVSDPIAMYKSDNNIVAKHYIFEHAKSWSLYWSEGITPLKASDELSALYALAQPAWENYIATDRYSAYFYTVFAALADIYTGRASPGLPGRPAPPHWRWDWLEETHPMVCLVSETAHPSTKQHDSSQPERMCLEYFDEKAVAAFEF